MGLDIGTKRTGVAISDESQTIAFPSALVQASHKDDWIRKLLNIIQDYELESIVVGLPLNQHGEEGRDAVNVRQYIALLRDRCSVPVLEWDERFTTVQAERALLEGDISREDRKTKIDKIAATILLQAYLDQKRFHRPEGGAESLQGDISALS